MSLLLKTAAAFAVFGLNVTIAIGQDYPNRPVRVITSPVGGSGDFVARILADGMSTLLGQPVIVDNRPTPLVPLVVAKSPPDGYTVALIGQSFWVAPFLEKISYDPIKDFSPISFTNRAPNILIVHPSLPVRSVKDLIALAKARPGQLNYGSSPTGSTMHLAAELFKSMAGVDIVRVTYRGGAQVLNDMLTGEIQLTFAVVSSTVTQHVRAGKLRALAVTSPQPTPLVPGVPTVAASLPGYESMQTQSILAPARTPSAIIQRLDKEIVRVLGSPEVKEKFMNAGVEAYASSPEELLTLMKAEMTRMSKIIQDAGITPE